jgi:tetratricopeptide (TPR) repeat protein
MTTLGRFKIMDQRYLDGLNDLKTAATLSDALRDDSTPLRVEMADTVASLCGNNEADRKKLPPLEAVSIYNEFEDLLPEGEEGAPALLNFADYLISMDLLDRAAGLINRALSQVTAPAQQADIGARLAAVYLLDSRPTLALEALERSNPANAADMDADLLSERTLLKARAQSQVNMTDAAIATLSGLASSDAQKLKADVLWRARRWGQAAAAIENLLPVADSTGTLDDETARLVMNSAVGYKLAGDTAKLTELRSRFGPRMAATTLGPTFNVVTRDGGSASLADRDTIMRIAGEVDMFKGFLDSYKAAAPAATATSETPAASADGNGG